jgi:ferrochelatase
VDRLALSPTEWTIGFQSRLGRTPWIKPYTDEILPELAARGVRRLVVSCPSFVSDCLETLEEIGIRAREDFIAAGGEDLKLVASVNAHEQWVNAVATMVNAAKYTS